MGEMISATVPMLRSYELPGPIGSTRTGRYRGHGLASFHPITCLFQESRHVSHVLSYAALKPVSRSRLFEKFS